MNEMVSVRVFVYKLLDSFIHLLVMLKSISQLGLIHFIFCGEIIESVYIHILCC